MLSILVSNACGEFKLTEISLLVALSALTISRNSLCMNDLMVLLSRQMRVSCAAIRTFGERMPEKSANPDDMHLARKTCRGGYPRWITA
jgi:hypothetical protein